jgi:hypothetical protein
MRSVRTILLLLALFTLSSVKSELYAVESSFSLILRTTLDTTLKDYQFMAVGWAEQEVKIPAPPAPPGDNFYSYIKGYFFKEIRVLNNTDVQSWDIYFTLSTKAPVRKYFTNLSHIIENTDYAVVVDGNGDLRHDLHKDSEIILDHSYNGKLTILALPKQVSNAPEVIPSFNNKLQIELSRDNTYSLDLKDVFVNTNDITSYKVDTFGNSDINHSISESHILTAKIQGKYQEIRLRVYAENSFGTVFTDLFLTPSQLTSVDESEIPEAVELSQNYPNPFNPTTTIPFKLNEASRVQLVVYSMNGQIVAELLNKNLSAGEHSVNFDATNLPSGIYIYRLQSSNTVLTKKMTLLK